MSKYSISNKDLTIFFLVNFGLTTIMGVVMAFAYSKYSVDSFGIVQMCYPALGVMIALLLNNEKRKELPTKFYGTYLFFSFTLILFLLVGIFIFHKDLDEYISYWMVFGSITLLLMYSFVDEKKEMDNFGLGFEKKLKVSIHYIVLFAILYLCAISLRALLIGGIKELTSTFKNAKELFLAFLLPFSFPFNFIVFLGEEYGWRYFLQTALQERLGKRKGVLLLGLIWGIWHLPLNLFDYNPSAPFASIINQLIVCTTYGIFFGLVYMKTENIWTVSFIHFLNNNLCSIVYGRMGVQMVPSLKLALAHSISMFIVYLPFLFAKEYRQTEVKVSNYTS